MRKLLLVAGLVLALGALGAQAAWAGCGCNKCHKDCGCVCHKCHESCGCSKCHDGCSNGGSCGCSSCAPEWCGDSGSGGYHLDCLDPCCVPKEGVTRVCIDDWDPCMKWADGKFHHPYELVFNGNGMLCDTGCCDTYIPCKRVGVVCHTECHETCGKDCCGCEHCSSCQEQVCTEIKRPRTIPWWFHPEIGNVYLDDNGKPMCGQELPAPEAAPVETPQAVTPALPPVEPVTPVAPPVEPETPPAGGTVVIDEGRG